MEQEMRNNWNEEKRGGEVELKDEGREKREE